MSSDAPQDRLQELGDRIDRLAERVEGLEVHVDQLAQALAATRGHEHHVPHPVRAAEHEVEHVRDVAEEGESAATPAIMAGGLLVVIVPIAALLIAAAVLIPILVTRGGGSSAVSWTLPNGDLANTRVVQRSSISSSNVSQLGVAWTIPLTANSVYGTFAANPVTSPDGVVYLQDLDSNVSAVDLSSGKVLWRRTYDSQDIGPNGVTYADGVVYDATAKLSSRSRRRPVRSSGGTTR